MANSSDFSLCDSENPHHSQPDFQARDCQVTNGCCFKQLNLRYLSCSNRKLVRPHFPVEEAASLTPEMNRERNQLEKKNKA